MTDPTLVPVAVACPCPGTPHDGDTVYLRPEPDLAGGILMGRRFVEMFGNPKEDEVFASLLEVYVTHGVASATFTDEDGEPLSRDEAIAVVLSRFSMGKLVADKADELYSKEILSPLVESLSKSLQASQTSKSTSRSRQSSRKRRKPLKPSSTPTSPTADTEAA